MSTLNILDQSGHRQLSWHASNAKEVEAAQKTFDRLIRHGYAGFGAMDGSASKRSILAFDPAMEEIVMVPRIVGG